MAPGKPKISFTFPYRWLEDSEDRKYLTQNFQKEVGKSGLDLPMHEKLMPAFISQFAIILRYHAYQPVKINLTQVELAKIFKTIIPGAKLVGYQTFFIQKPIDEGLPVMEMEIYY